MRNIASPERLTERSGRPVRSGNTDRLNARWSRLRRVVVEIDDEPSFLDAWARLGLMIGIIGIAAVIGVLVGSATASFTPWSELERTYLRAAGALVGFGGGWLIYARWVRTWADD